MPKLDGSPTKGEATSEQLKATKAELHRIAQDLEMREQRLSDESAAASLAEELRIAREEKKRERERSGERLPAHRPSEYTEEAAASLLQWITEGRSLRRWCEQAGIPAMTVYRWMGERAEFRERYARAHDDRADTLADEILDISDAVEGTDSIAAVQAARLRVEARKWIASKLKPSKWGDRQVVEQTGTVTFQLGIPSKQRDEKILDGKSLIREGDSLGLSDSKSDGLSEALVSPSFSSRPAGGAPLGSGEDEAPSRLRACIPSTDRATP